MARELNFFLENHLRVPKGQHTSELFNDQYSLQEKSVKIAKTYL